MSRTFMLSFSFVVMFTMVAPIDAAQRGAGPRGGASFVDANHDGICDHVQAGEHSGQRSGTGACVWCGAGAAGGSLVDIAATTLGVERSDLLTELRSGKSLAQVMEAHGRGAQDLVDAVMMNRKAAIDRAVAGGLTPTEAEQTVARIREHVQHAIAAPWTMGGRGAGAGCPWVGSQGHHRHGQR